MTSIRFESLLFLVSKNCPSFTHSVSRHKTASCCGWIWLYEERLNGVTDGDKSRLVKVPENEAHEEKLKDVGCNNQP